MKSIISFLVIAMTALCASPALAGDQGYASSSQAAMRRWCFASGQSGARHVMREDLMQ